MFSLVPRCEGLCVWQKYTRHPVFRELLVLGNFVFLVPNQRE